MNRHVLDPEYAAVGVFSAGVITSLDMFGALPRSLVPGVFIGLLLLLMTAEIATSYLSTPPPMRCDFDWEKRTGAKLLLIALVVISALLDGILFMAIVYLPGGFTRIPPWAEGLMPVTLSTVIWLSAAEAGRAILHVAQGTDVSNISPVVLWVIRQLRKVDAMRLPDGQMPDQRLMDHVTEDDITELLGKLQKRKDLEEPPPPLAHGEVPRAADVPPAITPQKRAKR